MTHDNTNTQTFRKTSTYAMVVTALMAAVTCILAPLSVPIGAGANITYQFCHFPVPLSAGLEKRHFKPPGLSVTRTCRSSYILWVRRWNL